MDNVVLRCYNIGLLMYQKQQFGRSKTLLELSIAILAVKLMEKFDIKVKVNVPFLETITSSYRIE